MECVIITGLSGAGRSSALRTFEDLGFFCVDNMPPMMAASFVKTCMEEETVKKVALVIDTRAGIFIDKVYDAIEEMKKLGVDCQVLFLDTADDVLIRRYKETRRKHPMNAINVTEGIATERRVLSRLKDMAKYVVDTSNITARQLQEMLQEMFAGGGDGVTIVIVSFGYKNGIPLDADLVFDVRFLPNPYYIEELKKKNGLTAEVHDYVFSFPQTQEFMEMLTNMITYLAPFYRIEGKYQVVVAIGCTGGMHRSVAVSDELYRRLLSAGMGAVIVHRDIDKDLYIKSH